VSILDKSPAPLQAKIDLRNWGGSTISSPPPAQWIPRDVEDYLAQGEGLLTADNARKKALNRSYLPATYITCPLSSEADVVRASILWFVHPIIVALQSWNPAVVCKSEVTGTAYGDGTRCDTMIQVGEHTVVVLEYKNRGYLNHQDFYKGCYQVPQGAQRTLDAITDYRIKTSRRFELLSMDKTGMGTSMGHNAAIITKQAVAYSVAHKVRHVALFDWDTLFLWNFAGTRWDWSVDRRLTSKPNPRWAFGTLVDRRELFRKALAQLN
jgi:hypothetical protein